MAETKQPFPSDRALTEMGLFFALLSIAGVGVPMIWPDQRGIGILFFVVGISGCVVVLALSILRLALSKGMRLSTLLSIVGTLMLVGGAVIGLVGAFMEDAADPATKANASSHRVLTLRQIFEADFYNYAGFGAELPFKNTVDQTDHMVPVRLLLDYQAGTKFLAVFIADTPDAADLAAGTFAGVDKIIDSFGTVTMKTTPPGDTNEMNSEKFVFSRTVYLYTQRDLPLANQAELQKAFETKGITLQIRGLAYTLLMAQNPKLIEVYEHKDRQKREQEAQRAAQH